MPRTAVGLFENSAIASEVVKEIEGLGLSQNDVRTLREPATFHVEGAMSFPRLDFETEVMRELTRIGAPTQDAENYLLGLRRGGALVLATGTDGKADEKIGAAAEIMNRRGALQAGDLTGAEPEFVGAARDALNHELESPIQAGRVLQSGGGAAFFVW